MRVGWEGRYAERDGESVGGCWVECVSEAGGAKWEDTVVGNRKLLLCTYIRTYAPVSVVVAALSQFGRHIGCAW